MKTDDIEDTEIDLDQLDKTFPAPYLKGKKWFWSDFPVHRQFDEMDCGPACLCMISDYYGHFLPLRFWRDKLQVNQEGTSLFDLAQAVEDIGIKTCSLQIDSFDQIKQDRFPLIALKENHFVVVFSIHKGVMIIGDPALGKVKQSAEEFWRDFSGQILLLSPTQDFYQSKRLSSNYLHFFNFFNGHYGLLAVIFISGICSTAFSTLPAFLSQYILDQVLVTKEQNSLILGLGVAFLVTSLMNVNFWIQSYFISYLSSKFDFNSMNYFMHKLLSLKYKFFANRHVGDFLHRIGEIQRLREFLVGDVLGAIFSLITLVFYAGVLINYSREVAILVFLTSPLLIIFSAITTKKMVVFFNQSFSSNAEQDSVISEHIRGIATVKSLAAESSTRLRFENVLVKVLNARYKSQVYSTSISVLNSLGSSFIDYAVMGLAAYISIKGGLTPGQVVSVSILAAGVVAPFESVANLWSRFIELKATLDRLNDIFLADSEKMSGLQPDIQKTGGEIEFRNVWFRYGGESSDWVLKDVSFKIKPGEKVSIVGRSGSGKSTLALLAARLYEPTLGTILIDGIDYRELDLNYLRQRLGILLQVTHLFQGTIKENIAWADREADMDKVELAASVASATHFILEKNLGFDYKITHSGDGLSGGQKQRIGIARLVYRQPGIIFLDEATSSLDQISEKNILASLNEALEGSTMVSIAHRYDTIRHADYAIVLSHGEIIEVGTDRELMALGGEYSSLFSSENTETEHE